MKKGLDIKMKNIPCKDGFIYSSMYRHRIKLLCYLLTVVVVFVMYFMAFKPYVLNVLCGSVPLDEQRFFKEAEMISIPSDASLGRNDAVTIRNYSLKSTSYWQDETYEFDVKLSDVYKTPITYTTRNTSDNFSEEASDEILSAVLYSAKINGVHTLVLAYPHQELADGITVTGIFTGFPLVVTADLAGCGEFAGQECYKYMLDIRGIEMESERFDIMVCAILLLLALYMTVKLVIYFVNPYLTPTYRGLDKYGDIGTVAEDVEAQLKEAGITKISKRNPAITEDWIVSEDSFKLKITKNHAKPQDSSRYGSKL